MRGVLGRIDQLEFRQIPHHLGWSLRSRRHQELVFDAVDDPFLTRFGNEVGRRNEGDRTVGRQDPETSGNRALRSRSKQIAVHVGGTATHCGACEDILGDEVLEKTLGRIDFDFAGLHVRLVHDASDAPGMIEVRVRIDHRHDGFPGPVLVVKVERGARGFRRYQGIVDRDALLALDDGQVRQVRAAHLVNAGNHFIEAGVHQELRHTPKTGIDGVGRGRTILDETGELREIPNDPAIRVLDDTVVRQSRDQSALGVGEIRLVRPWQ